MQFSGQVWVRRTKCFAFIIMTLAVPISIDIYMELLLLNARKSAKYVGNNFTYGF